MKNFVNNLIGKVKGWFANLDFNFSWKKIGEQALHFFYPAVCLMPLAMAKNSAGFVLSAMLLIAVREGIDQWPINNWKDTLLDSAVCLLGACAIGHLVL